MKSTAFSIILTGVFIALVIVMIQGGSSGDKSVRGNVLVQDGTQIITVNAKGGYQPRISYAQPDIPTKLRFVTNGTFDCSLSMRIPTLGINRMLPSTGSTDIDLGIPAAGTLSGSCGMGMYPFEIVFKTDANEG